MDHDMFIDRIMNNQEQVMSVFPVLSAMQESPVSDIYAQLHTASRAGVVNSDASNNGFSRASNTELEEQLTGGTVIYGASLATRLASSSSLQDNLSSLLISAPPIHLLNATRNHAFNAYSDALNISFSNPMNCGYDGVVGNVMDSNGWSISANHPYSSSKISNGLSLSLATSQSSVHRTSIVPDQCPEMSCCAVTPLCLNKAGLGSEQTSCHSKELSLSFGSQKPPQLSQAMQGSQYLQMIQEILAQIAGYSLDNLDQMSYYSADGMRVGSDVDNYSSSCPADSRFDKRAVETKKTELLTLLQAVDNRYNQCMDEIHTVISAFYSVTELDPQKHGSFALGTISCLYKNLRLRISNQILSLGAEFSTGGKEQSFEASFIQKQWTLQQQKRKNEHQLWRPQRGLPEKSVSVLRAWMFQNFLHPYPKDAEKHLLAVRSGLSRNQVSNWFINARVRLWKPMIEEMCSEMNERKARDQYEEGSNNVRRRSHRSTNNLRNSMN